MRALVALLVCALVARTTQQAPSWRPVVLMHGLLASTRSMSDTQAWIEADFPGIYVKNVEIGNGINDSIFMNIHKQVESLAEQIQADPRLRQGFNLIGHSQGGLLSRAYVQRYNDPPVFNLLSWAGPNAGQYGVPFLNAVCPESECPWLTEWFDSLLNNSWADPLLQERITFATYWKDPMQYDLYLANNTFLADLNNERTTKNSTYRKNLLGLNHLLLLHSLDDGILVPQRSPWFEFFDLGQNTTVQDLRTTQQYTGDWLGLRTLDESNRLTLRRVPCNHHQIPRTACKQFYEMYSRPLLNNTVG